jgi:hypothetical protein
MKDVVTFASAVCMTPQKREDMRQKLRNSIIKSDSETMRRSLFDAVETIDLADRLDIQRAEAAPVTADADFFADDPRRIGGQ